MKNITTIATLFSIVFATLAPILSAEGVDALSVAKRSTLERQELKYSQQRALAFADIEGVFGEAEIRQLSQLGVFEANSGNFQPLSGVTRADFTIWLVKTYNLLQTHNVRKPVPIPLLDGRRSVFRDVSPSHRAFPYIQSAYNAGFLVGYADRTFRPDELLTREEAIVLKSALDSKGSGNSRRSSQSLRNFIQKTRGYRDANLINDRYLSHIAFDLGNAASGRNFERVYGARRLYEPQKAVTRAEAAVLLSQFRKAGTASQAIEKLRR